MKIIYKKNARTHKFLPLFLDVCPSVVFDENSSGWSAGDLKYNKIYLEKYALESITAKYFILTELVSVDHRLNIERASP